MTTATQETKQIDRIWATKKAYMTGFFISMFVVLLGLITSSLINRFYPLEDTVINLLQAFSVVPGSAALFGVQGWEIQTWSGRTPAELLNQKLFNRFSLIGLFFPIVAFSLHSAATNELSSELEGRIYEKVKTKILQELTVQNLPPLTQNHIQDGQ
jgi:hypothetical protein